MADDDRPKQPRGRTWLEPDPDAPEAPSQSPDGRGADEAGGEGATPGEDVDGGSDVATVNLP
jgi:hypothetical protein